MLDNFLPDNFLLDYFLLGYTISLQGSFVGRLRFSSSSFRTSTNRTAGSM
jgi:hypothetical protein